MKERFAQFLAIGIALTAFRIGPRELIAAEGSQTNGLLVKVDIYSGFVESGGGTPYSGFVGSFTSPGIQFGSGTGDNWHPLGQQGFGADLTGLLAVPTTGNYTFSLRSDDGSLLFIDDRLAIDNGNLHSPAVVSQTLFLSQGVHAFEVQFFENGAGQSALDLVLPPGVSYTQGIAVIPPRGLSVSVGANATFRLASSGTPPIIIQWLFNDQPLAGATNPSLTLTNVKASQAGYYSVSVATGAGIQTYGPWVLGVDPTFTKITAGSIANDGGDSVGCAWGDYDNDGFLDLIVANGSGQNAFLYHNSGNGTFTRVTTGPVANSADSNTPAWADYDNNGTLDLFVDNYGSHPPFLFQNSGNGTFLLLTNRINDISHSAGCAWADYDNDGNLDLFVANNDTNGNFLYHGNGDGTFERVTTGTIALDRSIGGFVDGAWGDYNNDGKSDLFVTSEAGNSALYRNEGSGQFTKIAAAVPVNDGSSSGAAWADYDNDGNLDLVTTSGSEVHLYHNNGLGDFIKTVLPNPGQNLAGCAWGDYDNDGFLDLFITDRGGHNNVLYHNNGNGTFNKVTTGSPSNEGGQSWAAAWGDYDNDGFLDLFVCNRLGASGFENNVLYRNNGNSNHWLKVRLIGTSSNRSGIGAKVRLKAVIGGREMWQLREVQSGGLFGQATFNIHFGLGGAARAETMRIEWPSGIVQEVQNLLPNQFLTITEPPILRVGQGLIPSGFELVLTSRGGFTYDIQTSIDLVNWFTIKTATQVNGSVQVLDTAAKSFNVRFYRAVQR